MEIDKTKINFQLLLLKGKNTCIFMHLGFSGLRNVNLYLIYCIKPDFQHITLHYVGNYKELATV